MWQIFRSRLSPFQHKGFRDFFFAQNISLIGTWSHELARSWLVLNLAGTATALGSVLLASSLPGLFLSLHGGVVADRIDVKKFLIFTKIILALSAFSLFIWTEFYTISVPVIIAFGIIEGIVNSYDGPAFTTLFARIVPRSEFQQALAIQSSNFHLARMVGPVIAGALMAFHGPSIVFLFDAISYLWVIFVIKDLKLRPIAVGATSGATNLDTSEVSGINKATKNAEVTHGQNVKSSPLDTVTTTHRQTLKMFDGLKYFFSNPSLRYKMMHLFLSLGLILPVVTVVFRTYLKQKFDLDPAQFGYLFAFPALGSVAGTLYFVLTKKEHPEENLKWATPMLIIGLLLIHFANDPWSTAAILAFCGFSSYVNIAAVTQSLHLEVHDNYRGRLGSLIGLGFISLGPLMSFPVGYYTDLMGYDAGIIHFTVLFALSTALLAFFYHRKKYI